MRRVCVTGGTGSFGRAYLAAMLDSVERFVVVSRDEVKQGALADQWGHHPALRLFLADVRDEKRLVQCFQGCDTVIHAAALKRITQSVYSPSELIKTNVLGTMNVIAAATKVGVQKVLVISSDKAVEATNLYGKTKAVAEDYAVQANSYTYPQGTTISVVRYGNVMGSRGSVLEVWADQVRRGLPITMTDPRMTRFLISLSQAVRVVNQAWDVMEGGEIFLPALPATTLRALAGACYPTASWKLIGHRPGGEKLHESLLSTEELSRVQPATRHQYEDVLYRVIPTHHSWRARTWDGPYLPLFPYTSESTRCLWGGPLEDWLREAQCLPS